VKNYIPSDLPGVANELSFNWDTRSVSPGEYTICVQVSDDHNEATYCSEAPVEVTTNITWGFQGPAPMVLRDPGDNPGLSAFSRSRSNRGGVHLMTMSHVEELRHQIKHSPDVPGVYLYKDERGEVLYVGKALSLRKRLAGYLPAVEGKNGGRVPARMVEMVVGLHRGWIATTSEVEALLLEHNIIKQHRPQFNIRLRDDKSTPTSLSPLKMSSRGSCSRDKSIDAAISILGLLPVRPRSGRPWTSWVEFFRSARAADPGPAGAAALRVCSSTSSDARGRARGCGPGRLQSGN